jgi:DNA-directed RNA polymerase subunit RPC12/RpoP
MNLNSLQSKSGTGGLTMAEKEYIERGALLKKMFPMGIVEYGNYPINAGAVAYAINQAPTADVAPVKHGYWVGYEADSTYGMRDEKVWYKCSECGKDANGRCEDDEWYSYPILSGFCPHCGAKMDGEKEG